jgi:serine/threonine protein kinase
LDYPIGRGGFGKVWKVKCKLNNKYYAMKIMSKLKIIKKNSVKNINNEKKFLSILHNPFLVNMICSFQDNDNLYLVMDLLLGGDMRFHINKRAIYNRKKDEKQLKFIAGCVLVGLNYIHENQIIHKDIKPENLVFDSRGYIHITDFGISKVFHPDNGKENSGTPGYMAPEVLFNKDHNYSVDFFSLGVCLYELLMGKRPYHGSNKKDLRKDIVSRQARIREDNIPDGFVKSDTFFDCANFINSLLERKKEKRLGYNGFEEIRNHPWLIDFNWEDLVNKKIYPVFIPPVGDNNYDKKYCNEPEKIGDETQNEYEAIKSKIDYNKLFQNYSCNNKQFLKNIKISNEKQNKKNTILNQFFVKKNIFDIKKDINTIFKDKKLLRTFLRNNSQLINKRNTITNEIIKNNKNNGQSFMEAISNKGNNKLNKNSYNDISLSTTKNNSNISTNNIISDYHPLYEKKNNKINLYSKKFLKEESPFNQTNLYNSVHMISHYKNKSQIEFYKKNSQKKLPFIYKHLKKSISVENFHINKYNNLVNIQNMERIYNPVTLYGKYFPPKYSGINNHKNQYSYLNNYN